MTVFRFLFEIMQLIVLPVLLYFAIDSLIARVRVQKISMEPTLMPGEILLVNKLAYRFGEIDHGDIVTFHYPLDPDFDYVKRVIGLPGDEVVIKDGKAFVNDVQLQEPYTQAHMRNNGTWEVPQGEIFVMGDNRLNSSDSRSWGTVPVENIIGKALFVYWPLNQWGALTSTAAAAETP